MRRIFFLLLCAFLIPLSGAAQSFTSFDTIFTPAGYPDGALRGIVFVPSATNGISIVAVHGLGDSVWTMNGWCDTLAANGYTVLNIDYPDPVNSGATFPMPVRAIKAAVQWLRKSRDRFHLTNVVGALGRSLGAGLIAQSMIDEDDYSVFGIDSTTSDHLDFAALLYGIYDFTHYTASNLPFPISEYVTLYFHANPTLENRETPVLQAARVTSPLLLIHGIADTTLQYQQSVEFQDSLVANGKASDLILYPGEAHGFEASDSGLAFSTIGLQVKDSVLAFFSKETASAGIEVVNNISESTLESYPNPTGVSSPGGRSTVSIEFYLSHATTCTITLYNALGDVARSIPQAFFSSGQQSVSLDVHGLEGIYFCKLQTDVGVCIKSIVVEN